jgi:hypothetical protein
MKHKTSLPYGDGTLTAESPKLQMGWHVSMEILQGTLEADANDTHCQGC